MREVANRLLAIVRKSDVTARLGGDEFALILKMPVGEAIIESICSRIVASIAEPFDLMGTKSYIGASIGVARSPKDGSDSRELTRKADIALYSAKSGGRNRYVLFKESMDEAVQFRDQFNSDLRSAIIDCERQLHLAYQPIANATSEALTGVEALVRWNHPEKGKINPGTFIQFAEESGLIEELGEWILRQAVTDAANWPDLRLAINISPLQARQKNFGENIIRTLKSANFDPSRLELEITEKSLLDGDPVILQNLKYLRKKGAKVALDDFGVGLSSLSHIRDIEVDRIKIDRSFVTASTSEKGRALVQAIIGLAYANDISVTAEGIETKAQLEHLRQVGCDEIQGFYLSRPLSVSRFIRWRERGEAIAESDPETGAAPDDGDQADVRHAMAC